MSLHPIFEEALRPFAPRFAQTHCSQCGQPQGAGDSGYSACKQHKSLPTYWIGDDIKVKVDYDYTPGEPAVYDLESPACGPAIAPEIEINEVWLGEVNICELLADHVIESLKDQILAGVQS